MYYLKFLTFYSFLPETMRFLTLKLSQVYLTSQTFLTLNRPGIFYSTHAVRTHASAAAGMNQHAWTGMHEPACMNRHAWTGMHEPACMDRHAGMHGPACMLLQQLLLLRACARAWLPA